MGLCRRGGKTHLCGLLAVIDFFSARSTTYRWKKQKGKYYVSSEVLLGFGQHRQSFSFSSVLIFFSFFSHYSYQMNCNNMLWIPLQLDIAWQKYKHPLIVIFSDPKVIVMGITTASRKLVHRRRLTMVVIQWHFTLQICDRDFVYVTYWWSSVTLGTKMSPISYFRDAFRLCHVGFRHSIPVFL